MHMGDETYFSFFYKSRISRDSRPSLTPISLYSGSFIKRCKIAVRDVAWHTPYHTSQRNCAKDFEACAKHVDEIIFNK